MFHKQADLHNHMHMLHTQADLSPEQRSLYPSLLHSMETHQVDVQWHQIRSHKINLYCRLLLLTPWPPWPP